MSTTEQDPNWVVAQPSRSFFVSKLIKDITLRDAIGDLVDNSVDAIKAKASNASDLTGFIIDIKLGNDSFSINDNGFGMEAEIARKYAFNFGKSDSHKLINKSIGQFGIGMKRAFFKLGNNIKVLSIAKTSRFSLTIDVPTWQRIESSNWGFTFDKGTLYENQINDNNTGLHIKITQLSSDSTTSFSDKTFIDNLIKEISLEHMLNINKGLTIKINDKVLKSSEIALVNDETIKPSFFQKGNDSDEKSVKILAGIASKDAEDGGWYIFCNDRLIVAKSQHKETGWGDGLPKYHAQFHRFRGYVFFEAKDSSNLPWNTTKTGMDLDSPYYKEVRAIMVTMTRQVMDLLDKLKEEKEKDNPEDNRKLNKAVERSIVALKPVTKILLDTTSLEFKFQYPQELFTPAKKDNTIQISYKVSNEKYEKVNKKLGNLTPKETGLATFNYYLENEI